MLTYGSKLLDRLKASKVINKFILYICYSLLTLISLNVRFLLFTYVICQEKPKQNSCVGRKPMNSLL